MMNVQLFNSSRNRICNRIFVNKCSNVCDLLFSSSPSKRQNFTVPLAISNKSTIASTKTKKINFFEKSKKSLVQINNQQLHQQQQCRLLSGSTQSTTINHMNNQPPLHLQYCFTLDPPPGQSSILNKEQRDFYEENGYIVIRNMLNHNEIEQYEQRFNDYATGRLKPSSPELLLQKELTLAKDALSERTLYKIGELYADEVLFEYCKHPKVLDYVQCFTGPNIMAIHTMLINKPPDTGSKSSRHPLHQDLHYFPNRPADRIVCAWTAMEPITRDNGCLVAIPGTHKGEHLEHDYPEWEGGVNALYYGVKDHHCAGDRVHIMMETGDTILFHPLLIHGSGMNRTKGFRKAISCHYAPVESEFIDVIGTIQEKLAKETLAVVGKKLSGIIEGYDIDYATFWKLRARLVRGVGDYL